MNEKNISFPSDSISPININNVSPSSFSGENVLNNIVNNINNENNNNNMGNNSSLFLEDLESSLSLSKYINKNIFFFYY